MPYLRLQPHVSFGLIDDRPVFLDIRRDRYFTLEPQAEATFGAARRNMGAYIAANPGARQLLATELFSIADKPQPLAEVQIAIPEAGPLSSRAPRSPSPLDVANSWVLLSRARRALRKQPIELILAARQGCRAGAAASADGQTIEELSERFRRARSFVPIEPSCLQDSLALHGWLAGRGALASIVFGVKLDPFAAHCWVQSESAVLNDAPDKVAEFTPVLIVS